MARLSISYVAAALVSALALVRAAPHPLPQPAERQDLHIFRRAAMTNGASAPLKLKPLAIPYNALEPVISKDIMILHHDKHLQGYINGYNEAVQKHIKAGSDLSAQLAVEKSLAFNAGGIVNHYMFFDLLTPPKSPPNKFNEQSTLAQMITKQYGSLDQLKIAMNKTTAALQGSGWIWLGYNRVSKALEVSSTPNQETLLTADPVIGIDVWEHAYYLQYKNLRYAYLAAIWDVINWDEAQKRFEAAQKQPPM